MLTSSTTTTAKYYFIAGQRVAEQVGSTFSYLIPNLEGSPTVALSSTGSVSAVQLFLPYGAQGFAWGTMPTAHNYTDQLLDSVMGLLYYGARYYDPLADQFVSVDSVQGNPSGLNPYGYVDGNPETYVDPSGHAGRLNWWEKVINALCLAGPIFLGLCAGAPNGGATPGTQGSGNGPVSVGQPAPAGNTPIGEAPVNPVTPNPNTGPGEGGNFNNGLESPLRIPATSVVAKFR